MCQELFGCSRCFNWCNHPTSSAAGSIVDPIPEFRKLNTTPLNNLPKVSQPRATKAGLETGHQLQSLRFQNRQQHRGSSEEGAHEEEATIQQKSGKGQN